MIKAFPLPFFLLISFFAFAQNDINEIKVADDNNKVYEIYNVEMQPEFKGGRDSLQIFIEHNLVYPTAALKNEVDGKVIVGFIVEKDGKVSHVEVVKNQLPDMDYGCTGSAIDVIKLLPAFKPGKVNGNNVRVHMTATVIFDSKAYRAAKFDKYYDYEKVYDIINIDKPASYPGGENALLADITKNLNYPAKSLRENNQGKIIVSFIIDKAGHITEVKVKKGIEGDEDRCNDEAVRVVKLLKDFTPGIVNGKPVKMAFQVPIIFKIKD